MNLPSIAAAPDRRELPLSYQQAMWWELEEQGLVGYARTDGSGRSANLHVGLRCRGPLDRGVLQSTLDAIVDRHESLRTRVKGAGALPIQLLRSAESVSVQAEDLTRIPESARQRDGLQIAADAILRPFDYANDQALRACLLRLSDADHVVILITPHLVSDTWSLQVLLNDFVRAYANRSARRSCSPPPAALQYGDFVAWQRRWLHRDGHRDVEDYYLEKVSDARALTLPADVADGGASGRPGTAEHRFELGQELSGKIVALARQACVTPYVVLLSAYVLVLGRWSGRQDVLVMTPFAGRSHVETASMIGFFATPCPLRTDLSGDPDWMELIHRVDGAVLDAHTYQYVPYRFLQELARAHQRSAPALTIGMNAIAPGTRLPPAEALGLEGVNWTTCSIPIDSSVAELRMTCDLDFLVLETRSGAIGGMLRYRSGLFQSSTVAATAEALRANLECMVQAPARRVCRRPTHFSAI